jgi:hypothetical protein
VWSWTPQSVKRLRAVRPGYASRQGWISASLSLRVERSVHESIFHFHLVPRLEMNGASPPPPPRIFIHGLVLGHRDKSLWIRVDKKSGWMESFGTRRCTIGDGVDAWRETESIKWTICLLWGNTWTLRYRPRPQSLTAWLPSQYAVTGVSWWVL